MIRTFVFIAPYGPSDFTVCDTFRGAEKEAAKHEAAGKPTKVVQNTGTIGDLRPLQRDLRAAYAAGRQALATSGGAA